MEKKEEVTLVCTSLDPNEDLINKMLSSAKGFKEIILHIDNDKKPKIINPGSPVFQESYPTHLGVGEAYNWMIKTFVKTEWVCCFCDDDYFYPEGLSKMINEVHEGIIAGVAHFKFHVSGYCPPQDKRCWFGRKEYDLCEKKRITPQLLERHGRLPAGSFFRKRAWELVDGFQGKFEHDRDLWWRMAIEKIEFKYFDHLVYNFVRRENSAWIRQNRNLHDEEDIC